jgi:hypothetical protein
MDVKNLVLEIGENESASDLQARLDKAGEDGFFLVNVVGRLAFLRTTVTQPKQKESKPLSNVDGKENEALDIIKAHMGDSIFNLVQRLNAVGIKRGKNWVCWKRRELSYLPPHPRNPSE